MWNYQSLVFPSFTFLQHQEIFSPPDRSTWHLPHDHKSMQWSCQNCKILQIEIQQLSFIVGCGENLVKCDRIGNNTLLGWGQAARETESWKIIMRMRRIEEKNLGMECVCLWTRVVEEFQLTSSRNH